MLTTDLKSPLPAAPIATEAHPFERELPRHDWILIPLLFLISTLLLAASVELTARKVFSESQKTLASCMILKDPATGPRGMPNTVCKEKNPEANWIETRFDRCGYRNDIQCGPKPPGTFRIVMTGSSTALGERVQREESFASLLPAELSAKTGLKVELYNESMNFGFPYSASLRFNDIFAQQPDLVLWTLTPIDIQSAALALPSEEVQKWNNQDFATKLKKRILNNLDSQPLLPALADILGRTRTGLVLRHFFYLSHSQYLKSYFETSDEEQGFLKSDPSKRWRDHLVDFESTLVKLADKSKAAGVPFVVSLIPNRAQTAMISDGTWPQDYDPHKLDSLLRQIVERHGGIYLNISDGFAQTPNPERFYFPVDGHANPQGHVFLSRLLTDKLTSGAVPALASAASSSGVAQIQTATHKQATSQTEHLK